MKKILGYFKKIVYYIVLGIFALFFIMPIFIVLMNSFKSKLFIIDSPFSLPNANTFVGFENYINGIVQTNFVLTFIITFFITIVSTFFIVILSAMFSWYCVRVNNKIVNILYYLIVFSMIVPFQMVMYTLTYVSNQLRLNNPLGIILIYIGFGCGLSVFTYTGYLKNMPIEIEESALLDGCSTIEMFSFVVFPVLKPVTITIATLNVMWIWNDYLLPYLILGTGKYMTLPVSIQQSMKGLYGDVNWGSFMSLIIMTIIPIIIFYFISQKSVNKETTAGAIKG